MERQPRPDKVVAAKLWRGIGELQPDMRHMVDHAMISQAALHDYQNTADEDEERRAELRGKIQEEVHWLLQTCIGLQAAITPLACAADHLAGGADSLHLVKPGPDIEIPRKSPTIRAVLGGRAVDLTWYNTVVQLYRDPYQDMRHIQVACTEQQFKAMLFNCSTRAHELMQLRYPVRMDAEPTATVLKFYAESEGVNLDDEIGKILGGDSE